jgi:hypothetical protein
MNDIILLSPKRYLGQLFDCFNLIILSHGVAADILYDGK